MTASFADAQVGRMGRPDTQPDPIIRNRAWRRTVEDQRLVGCERVSNHPDNGVAMLQTDDRHPRPRPPEKRLAETLREAARDDHLPHVPHLLVRERLLDGFERLDLGRLDEAARVDDHHIGPLGLGGQQESRLDDFRQHPLAVHHVFRASQGHESHRHLLLLSSLSYTFTLPSRRELFITLIQAK